MSSRSIRVTVAASLAACAGFVFAPLAEAQAPPIKPGLWQVKQTGAANPQAAHMAAQLDRLSPAQRAQVEAMMKQRGVSIGASGMDIHVCMTKETLDPTRWEHRNNCKTDFSSRTSSLWKFHTTCPNSQSDGEVVFTSPESYSVKVTSRPQGGGDSGGRQMSMQARWLGANCGDVKPFTGKN